MKPFRILNYFFGNEALKLKIFFGNRDKKNQLFLKKVKKVLYFSSFF